VESLSRTFALRIPCFGHVGDGNIHVNIMVAPDDATGAARAHDAERALFEVYDVAGRRMLAREVGSLGVGQHHLDLSQEAHLPAGVYQLCLTQGAQRAIRRAVVLR